ncbi:D-glucuronyl C5-epimerase family protein [Caulobacter soli]|uniref:D-glucuronyl C5-epimerase family protein n=1 Tax=Caulobacter soli TaxID=2708539 RepID=UPI0013EC8A99|nr:D-glucuronyl C5-epimerase family protein [Caulobacter soli]
MVRALLIAGILAFAGPALAGPTAVIGGVTVNRYDYALKAGYDGARPLSLAPSTNEGWTPKSPTDYPQQWPEAWITWGQPFAPYVFASDAAIMLGESRRDGDPWIYQQMALNLDAMAMELTETLPSGATQIVHRFGYDVGENFAMPAGFRGAFANSMVAIGYLHFYEMDRQPAYLIKAQKMLDGITDVSGKQRLFTVDSGGFIWFEEVIAGDKAMGVYNGHMAAVFAMLEYRRVTKSTRYDPAIEAGITTMAHWLPVQRRPEGYFAYSRDFPTTPDYGQERAVFMVEALCSVTSDFGLCGEAKAFRQDFTYRATKR